MLARPAAEITMAEVVEALEGSIAPIECISEAADGSIVCSRESSPEQACPTKLLWTRVRFSIVSTLRETTLADLLRASGRRPERTAGAHRAGAAGARHANPDHSRLELEPQRWPT